MFLGGFSMTLSSRRGLRCGGLICRVVAQHRPQDIEASACQCQDGLAVALTFGAFAVVVGARGRVGSNAGQCRQVAGSQQPTVVAAGPLKVAADAAGVTRYRGQPGDTGEAVNRVEGVHVAAGGGEEFGTEGDTE